MSSRFDVRYGEEVGDRMEAVVMTAPGELEVRSVPVPAPDIGEVLVKVECATICGTDVEIIKGRHLPRWPPRLPAILGHEWAGRIVAMGPMTDGFGLEMGDAVAGTSHAGCGACRMCLIGRYNLCFNYGNEATGHRQYGHVSQGAYAEYVANNVRALHRMPEGMSFEHGSAVDPAGEQEILDGLADLDATVIMVAYRRASIIAADEVIFLEEGRIAGRGPHGHLYRTLPAYAALVDAYEIYETIPANAELVDSYEAGDPGAGAAPR